MQISKSLMRRIAVRIWCWISFQVNHPEICRPSEWLVEQIAKTVPADRISDEIWKVARKSLCLRYPGLDRGLNSPYHPGVANVLDVAYHYGSATQKVLRRLEREAYRVAHAGDWVDDTWSRDSWIEDDGAEVVCYSPPTGEHHRGAHISVCPDLLCDLASMVREGRAPKVEEIPRLLEDGRDNSRVEVDPDDFPEERPRVLSEDEVAEKIPHQGLRRLLEKHKISLEKRGNSSVLTVTERQYDNWHCPNGRDTWKWSFDGESQILVEETREEPHGYFQGGYYWEYQIKGGTYAFRYYYQARGLPRRAIDQLIVFPGWDPELVFNELSRLSPKLD